MDDGNDIELRTEEVTEILTSTPRWLFRWGISVVFIMILFGVGLSCFVNYPDILTSEITLTTINPPVNLLAKSNGKITHLLVKNNEIINANQTIAVIENTANYLDVLYLDEVTNKLIYQLKLIDSIPNIIIADTINVGDLTPYNLQFLKAVKDVNLYRNVNPYKRQIRLLKKDLVSYGDLLIKYKKQESINKEQLNLAETDYNRDKSLFDSKVISSREYDNKKKEYLSALNSYESVKITVSNALIQINSIEKNILQMQIEDYQEQTKLKNELTQSLKTLISEMNKWKHLYLVQSPIKGKVSFFSIWTVNQNIKVEDELFSVVPYQKQEYIGKCFLPTTNTGKLKIGQMVNIKLDNYPFNEIGILAGIVTSVSSVPNKNTYAIDVKLVNGLKTSYNKTIIYKEEMKGKADIITENISVMDRVFFNFRKIMNINKLN